MDGCSGLVRQMPLCSLQDSVLLQKEKEQGGVILFFFYLDLLHVYQGERISALEIICFHKL